MVTFLSEIVTFWDLKVSSRGHFLLDILCVKICLFFVIVMSRPSPTSNYSFIKDYRNPCQNHYTSLLIIMFTYNSFQEYPICYCSDHIYITFNISIRNLIWYKIKTLNSKSTIEYWIMSLFSSLFVQIIEIWFIFIHCKTFLWNWVIDYGLA